jgi:myo-inositol-1(or 4)-monophosphatase
VEPTITIALRAARKAGDIIARATERMDLIKIEEKEKNDFVTNVDKAAEEEIIYQLQKAYPEHNILAEESGLQLGSKGKSDTTWYIDPLDGTTNFLRGIPHFCVSIACVQNGRVEHAVVYDPIRREEFVASRGRGASLNGVRLRVSDRHTFDGALIGTGIPYRSSQQAFIKDYMNCLEHFAANGSGIRRGGSAALDLAYVAAGRLDAFWEYGLRPWDVAGGLLLIQEAGGLTADFKGGDTSLKTVNVVCGNPKLFKELLKVVNSNLGDVQKST